MIGAVPLMANPQLSGSGMERREGPSAPKIFFAHLYDAKIVWKGKEGELGGKV